MKCSSTCNWLFLAAVLSPTMAFAPVPRPRNSNKNNWSTNLRDADDNTGTVGAATTAVNGSASSSSAAAAVADDTTPMIIAQLKELLEHLDGPDGGVKLWQASSSKWQAAIRQAVGAPSTAQESVVAQALYDAMSRRDNQFALLVGAEGPKFEATFPSDAVLDKVDEESSLSSEEVEEDSNACWVECRLRSVETDDLLVTMGINLVKEGEDWKIHELQWQDFRDAYYPGLSGREWLRAF